jgi:hypothetical protein
VSDRRAFFDPRLRAAQQGTGVSAMFMPVECAHCRQVYDAGKVTVTARYLDCSVWKSPCCGLTVDDRTPPWGIRHYWELDSDGTRKGERNGW